MAENQFSVAVPNLLQAITLGEQGYKDQRLDNARNQLQNLLSQGGPIDLQRAAIQQLSQGDMEGAKTLGTLYGHQMGQNSVYGTPIYGTGPNGETQIGSFNKTGTFVPINTGNFTPTPGVKAIEGPTGTTVIQSRSGQVLPGGTVQPGQAPVPGQAPGFIPKDVSGAAQQHAQGEGAGKAAFSLPNTIATIDQSIGVIDQLMKHPGRETATGVSGMLDPRNYIPATNARDFQVMLKQLEGQTFLQQYNELRGAGAITEAEGSKATQAKARLDRAQSDGEFLKALQDLKDVLVTGRQRAIQMAQKPQNAPLTPRPVQTQSFTAPQAQPVPAAPQQSPTGAPQAPRMGEVRDGYRFKGGNPADESSWVQLR